VTYALFSRNNRKSLGFKGYNKNAYPKITLSKEKYTSSKSSHVREEAVYAREYKKQNYLLSIYKRLIAEGYAKRHQKAGFQKYLDDALAELKNS
jgi:hypothetical protein